MYRASPDEALARLRDGNQRFVTGTRMSDAFATERRPNDTLEQEPFAIVLGCSDARVPAEIVFDQGLGDLFVIRVAGNIVAESQIGSVEFAAERFGTRLVVVLGHTNCGAIAATLEQIQNPGLPTSPNLRAIVDRVRPAIDRLPIADLGPQELIDEAVRANIQASVAGLRRGSELIERSVESGQLAIVGAEYVLATGLVEFYDAAGLRLLT